MSESRTRRTFSPRQKAEVVRRHLVGNVAVSDLADELGVQPSQIHGWVNLVLSQAEKAFERAATNGRSEQAALATKVEHLQAKIVHKNEVIAELMEANVQAKKELGEL